MITLITQRVDFLKDINERRDSLDQKLSAWVSDQGATPVLVPNKLSNLENWISQIKPQAIILSGGNDIGQFPERDKVEFFLINFAKNNRLPLLGICRGMQMLGIAFGAELKKVSGHVRTRHTLNIANDDGTWPKEVNSFHDYSLTACPKDFTVAAFAEDGNIEAIVHSNLPIEGWMWHPEREQKINETNSFRIRRLFGIK